MIPSGTLTAHTDVAARCATEAFITTGVVHIEDCEGWCGGLVPRLLHESLGTRLVVWAVVAQW